MAYDLIDFPMVTHPSYAFFFFFCLHQKVSHVLLWFELASVNICGLSFYDIVMFVYM